MAETTYKYLDPDGLARFKSKIQDILDTKVDKETGKYIVTVDESLSSSSTNPVRNSAVTVALNGKLGTSGDSKDNTVSFTTGDVANDAAATSWTENVGTISSGLSHATLLNRLSLAVKNIRYLKNILGNTDISAIGSGTVTGLLSELNTNIGTNSTAISKLNTDLSNAAQEVPYTTDLGVYTYIRQRITAGQNFGTFLIAGDGTSRGTPDGTSGWIVSYEHPNGTTTIHIYAQKVGSAEKYFNRAYTDSDNVGTWSKLPTRAEVNQLSTDLSSIVKIAIYEYTFTGDDITNANPQHNFNIALNGYTPIGAYVTQTCDNMAYVYVQRFSQANNTCFVQLHSIRPTPQNDSMPLTICVLYVRSSRL